MNNKKVVILNNNEIEKFNDYSCKLGTCKNAFNLLVRCIEEDISESPTDMISLIYVVYFYIEILKKEFTEFLDECNILL